MPKRLKFIRAISWAFALAAGAAVAISASLPAQAYDGRNGLFFGGAGAGLIGGLALGSILAQPRPVYAQPIYGEPVYRQAPRYVPTCHLERRRVWISAQEYTYRRVEVCD